jgi:hypothetical protein
LTETATSLPTRYEPLYTFDEGVQKSVTQWHEGAAARAARAAAECSLDSAAASTDDLVTPTRCRTDAATCRAGAFRS